MNQKLLILACASLVVLAACKPPTPAEPTAAPATAPTDSAAPAVSTDQAKPAEFDVKAFAGTFSGTLPCASCPGIDTRLELAADGTYRIDETYQDEKDGHTKGDGTWTAEENGKRVRLDPNSKSDEDRLYEVVSNDEIRLLDQTGKSIQSELNYSLKRATAAK